MSNNYDLDVITYTKLIIAFFKTRKVADAPKLLFDEMLSCGLIPCTGTLSSFLEPLCSYGSPHTAMIICKKASKVGCRIVEYRFVGKN